MENDIFSPCLLKPLPPFKVCGPFGSCVNNTCICDKGWSIPSWTKLSRSDTCSVNFGYGQIIYTAIFVLDVIQVMLLIYKVIKKFPTIQTEAYANFFFSLFITFLYCFGTARASHLKAFNNDKVAFFETVSFTILLSIVPTGTAILTFVEIKKYAELQERFAQKLNLPDTGNTIWVKRQLVVLKILGFGYPFLIVISSVHQDVNLLRLAMLFTAFFHGISMYLSQGVLDRTKNQVNLAIKAEKNMNVTSANGSELLKHLTNFSIRTSGYKKTIFWGNFPGFAAGSMFASFSGVCAFIDLIVAFEIVVLMITMIFAMLVSLMQNFGKKKRKSADVRPDTKLGSHQYEF